MPLAVTLGVTVTSNHSLVNFEMEDDDGNDVKDTFVTNLALFYLRMQAKMLLPATTIQTLIVEFQVVHDLEHIF